MTVARCNLSEHGGFLHRGCRIGVTVVDHIYRVFSKENYYHEAYPFRSIGSCMTADQLKGNDIGESMTLHWSCSADASRHLSCAFPPFSFADWSVGWFPWNATSSHSHSRWLSAGSKRRKINTSARCSLRSAEEKVQRNETFALLERFQFARIASLPARASSPSRSLLHHARLGYQPTRTTGIRLVRGDRLHPHTAAYSFL